MPTSNEKIHSIRLECTTYTEAETWEKDIWQWVCHIPPPTKTKPPRGPTSDETN